MKKVLPSSSVVIAKELLRRSQPTGNLTLITSFGYEGVVYDYDQKRYYSLEDAINQFVEKFKEKYGIDLSEAIKKFETTIKNKSRNPECLRKKENQDNTQETTQEIIQETQEITWETPQDTPRWTAIWFTGA